MIFRPACENCGLNQAKPDFFSTGCGLAKLRLASRLKFAAYQYMADADRQHCHSGTTFSISLQKFP